MKKWQIVVAAMVAVVEMILRLDHVVYAPFYALFLVGPVAFLIENWFSTRRAVPAQAPA